MIDNKSIFVLELPNEKECDKKKANLILAFFITVMIIMLINIFYLYIIDIFISCKNELIITI